MGTAMHAGMMTGDQFKRDVKGLPDATGTEIVDLASGDTYELVAAPVRKRIGDAEVRMLAYNGSVPGPTLRVRQGSAVTIGFTNEADLENTVHWHGLRVENRFDGTHEMQAPVPVGGRFTYQVRFPDPGVYWYHPHVREDYGQELGLYGNVLVVPEDENYWPPAHREVLLTLDDILIEEGKVAPFSRTETTFAAMGRYGNTLLVNGETELALTARGNEVVRFYLTNTANSRVFNVGFDGARMKLVGGDSGRVEREVFVDRVVIAPSERAVVDVLFDAPGAVTLTHETPERVYPLAAVTVSPDPALPALADAFSVLRTNPEFTAEREQLASYLDAVPDKTLSFVARMDMGAPDSDGPVSYACPMHPEVVSAEPGRCPKCGMSLLATASPGPTTFVCPMHPEVVSDVPGRCPTCGMQLLPSQVAGGHGQDHGHHEPMGHAMAGHEHHGHQAGHGHHGHNPEPHAGHRSEALKGIEWEDDMVEVNRMTTTANTRWLLIDRATGDENHAIGWHFRVGDRVKIRLVNEMDSDHPMHHPFHIHGAGRFLVIARDGAAESNLVWKDTVLVRTGETVDILLNVTNPGVWMAHCHIAEHHESGMMLSFHVSE